MTPDQAQYAISPDKRFEFGRGKKTGINWAEMFFKFKGMIINALDAESRRSRNTWMSDTMDWIHGKVLGESSNGPCDDQNRRAAVDRLIESLCGDDENDDPVHTAPGSDGIHKEDYGEGEQGVSRPLLFIMHMY